MTADLADQFRPVAPPYVIEGAYTEDQRRRIFKVVRENAPWPLILAETSSLQRKLLRQPAGRSPKA